MVAAVKYAIAIFLEDDTLGNSVCTATFDPKSRKLSARPEDSDRAPIRRPAIPNCMAHPPVSQHDDLILDGAVRPNKDGKGKKKKSPAGWRGPWHAEFR